MQQKTKLGINFGFRGWMLMIFEISAFLIFQALTNFPMNILPEVFLMQQNPAAGELIGMVKDMQAAGVALSADIQAQYNAIMAEQGGIAQFLSTLYTVGMLVGIVLQLVMANFVGKMKSIKPFTLATGLITIIAAFGVALLPYGTLFLVAYFLVCVFSTVYGMFAIGILIGQWFPTRKGVFMGIATFAFPICNGLMGPFANTVFRNMETTHIPDVFGGFLPYLIVGIVGWIIGLVFIKDYPEQCGCYRDNDKSFTKERADAMLAAEIENKKTTVWKIGNTFKCAQFWLIVIPMGTLLGCSVGMMTQTTQIFGAAGLGDMFSTLMAMVMIFALVGSYVLGLIDGKFGTKTAVTVSVIVMLLAGVFGAIGGKVPTIIAVVFLAIFMGAGSNFTVSGAAQYWRREDFSTVFGYVNPIANVIQCLGPMMVAMTVTIKATMPFLVTAIIAVISLILILCFKPAKVKAADDKYRAAAGKPLDDALVGRK